jgi:subtilisin family serine protease/N-acetylneuraminic acid mutarotase
MSGSRSRQVVPARVFVFVMVASVAFSQVTLARTPAPVGGSDAGEPDAKASLEAGLLDRLRSGSMSRFVVEFASRADLIPAWRISDHGDRGAFVVSRLKDTAREAQQRARDLVLGTKGASFEASWLRNSMLVKGGAALAERLALLPGVKAVRAERTFPLVKPVKQRLNVEPNVGNPEWGITQIGADEVWADGITGQGVVIGNIDTGVDYLHEALVDHYRGNLGGGTFDHNYNWWDPTDICGDEPCDNALHGTHTMGTMVGGDGPGPFSPDIGVAPGATWIAAKGCEDLFCSEFALLSSGEFMLAPTDLNGENPDPDKRPHILNNSWGGGPGEDWYLDVVTAWRAAGIIPVFSSGNPGPDCGFGGSPGDYLEAFSAGATDIDDVIADFSGRGPSVFGKVNPDISAPGVDVVSSIPDDEYAAFSGTSMAAPHTSGTLALMLSSAPGIVGDFEAATSAVRDTALDIIDESCGGDEDGDPNNVYGDGRIDAFAAVQLVATGGTLTGTVTASGSGEPLGGAKIVADGVDQDYTGFTDAAGVFELFVQEGEYDITASVYAYAPATQEDVFVPEDDETIVDFVLDALPAATVTGTVTDASGHGWPLYARIEIEGYPLGPVFTDPFTGQYSVELVESTDFVFRVTAVSGGYVEDERPVGPLAGDAVEDFALAVDAELCDAPGYVLNVDGLHEPFSSGELPEGWTIVDNAETGSVWRFDDPGNRGNLTGASGGFAIVDSDDAGPNTFQDTELVSPVIDLTTVDAPVLRFATDYVNLGDTAEVDISIDGGESWDTLLSWNENMRGPLTVSIEVPEAANQAEVQVRFHYFEASWAWWWEVDQFILGGETSCDPMAGGLVAGHVYDGITGLALNGADVISEDDPDIAAVSAATPEDENLDDGFYQLFSPLTGDRDFTASASQYSSATETVSVVADAVVRQDFALGAGLLTTDPDSVEVTLPFGGTTSEVLTITNEGTADATFEIRERSGGREILGLRGAQLIRRSGTFSPHSLVKAGANSDGATPSAQVTDAPWTDVAGHPVPIMDNTADAFDGKVYSVGGFDGGANLNLAFVYDPGSDTWSEIASMSEVREKPAAAFVDGLLYVIGGWDDVGGTVATLEIYDPGSDTWSTGADVPAAYAAATAVSHDGLLYVIGGCTEFCGVTDVQVYDPGTDEWTFVAPYPEEVSWSHCASLDGLVYCAGGVSDSAGELDAGYAYDADADAWNPIAPLPQTQWAGGYVGAGGQLLVSGGVTDDFSTVTNAGWMYDPGSDSWSELPNSNNALYRGGSACGFYKIGGSEFGFSPVDAVELLPDLDDCGAAPDVTWLSVEPAAGSLVPSESAEVTLSFDASVAEVDQPGAYHAMLTFKEDTPYAVSPVQVTMNVTPPDDWGKLEGTVTGLSRCDGPGGPLARATVLVAGVSTDFALTTDGDGYFEWWMPEANGPVTLTVSRDGWVTKSVAAVAIAAGETTTEDVTLRLAAPCADAEPDSLEVTLLQNDVEQLELVLSNIPGARAYQFLIEETEFGLSPMAVQSVAMRTDFSAPARAGGPASIRSADRRIGPNDAGTNAPPWFGANDIPGGLVRFAHAQCDAEPNVFYVVGGVDGTFEVSDRLWRFDAETTEWTELASIPEGGEGPTATCEAGRIHVMGGDGTDRHYIYTIASDSWSTGAPLPRPVWGAAAAGWNGQIFLVGGDDDFFFGGTSDEVNVYDIASDTWVGTGEPMPVPTGAAGFFQSGPHLYVVGGWDDSSPDFNVGATQRYDLVNGFWEMGPWLAFPRADFALAATDQALYAIGGDEEGGSPFDASRTVERLDLGAWPDGAWEEVDRIGVPLTANNGGFCGTATFDPGTEVWSAGGADANLNIQGRMLFRQAAGETCPTIRSEVDWLSVSATSGSVRRDRQRTLTVTVDAGDLPVGEHDATLLISTTDPARAEMRVPVHVTVLARPTVAHLSVAQTAVIDGVTIRNEDVFTVFDDGSVELLFDGSDLGMGGMAVDAFAFAPDGSLVMSFTQPAGVPGIIGTVDDSDLVRFVADSLGPDTAGVFVRYFDGSDVGLGTDAEDIDALEIRGSGVIFVSTTGTASVPGIASADDSDVLRFVPSSLGGSTSGTWHRWFDGSDVGLTTNGEDVDALALFGGAIGLSTTGTLLAPDLRAADEDVVAFDPRRLGSITRGEWAGRYFDGSHFGLGANDITGFETS